jgi:hypothetical protein
MNRRSESGQFADLLAKQQNTLPGDVLRNDADFNDALLRPRRPLTLVQRLGAITVGLMFLSPVLVIVMFGRDFIDGGWFTIGLLLVGVLVYVFVLGVPGFRILINGIAGRRISFRPRVRDHSS